MQHLCDQGLTNLDGLQSLILTQLLADVHSHTMPAKSLQTRRSFSSAFLVSSAANHWAGIRILSSITIGAFTPGCQAYHLPPYISKINDLKAKGVELVAVIASNDAWVMSAWGKVNGIKGDTPIVSSVPE